MYKMYKKYEKYGIKSDKITAISVLTFLAMISLHVQIPVYGQPAKPKANNKFSAIMEPENMGKLTNPPELPGVTLPGPPAKFLYGYAKDAPTGHGVGLRFKMPDNKDQVIQFYRSSLQSQQWKLGAGTEKDRVTASDPRTGNSVMINVFPNSKGSTMMLSYTFKHR